VVAGMLALAAIAGCRSSKKAEDPVTVLQGKINEEVRAVVKDPNTAPQVEALAQQVVDLLRQMENSAYRARLNALNANYDATPQQFNELYAGYMTTYKALLKQSVEIRERMAGLLTDEEWKKLKDLRADIRTLGITIN
jgi:ABC-type sulfate transport system substrate-binding protein